MNPPLDGPAEPGPVPGVGMVWAQARGGVIGRDGVMPWHLPEDLAHFRAVTHGGTVVMGRSTWFALPERFRPLPGRRNVVLSRQPDLRLEGATVARSLPEALIADGEGAPVWVIGGGQVYAAAMPYAARLVVTEIDLDVAGDTLAPPVGTDWQACGEPDPGWLTSAGGIAYRFREYLRERSPAADGS